MKQLSPCHLIIFAKYPHAGMSKTRLIPSLGPENAALLQKAMTELTIQKITPLLFSGSLLVHVFFTGGSLKEMRCWLGSSFIYREQAGGDLGVRMSNALAEVFLEHSASHAVIIGTDIYHLDTDIILQAFDSLRHNDLVLGPAVDGGYYLIGLNEPQPGLFENIAWGTSSVLETTLNKAKRNKMRFHLLRILHDIDRPEDLKYLDEDFISSSLAKT